MTTADLPFDDYGLPRGDAALPLLKRMAQEACEELNSIGWDQPPTMIGIYPPSVAMSELGINDPSDLMTADTVINLNHPDSDHIQTATIYLAKFLPISEHLHHYRELAGYRAPNKAVAVLFMTEAWMSTGDTTTTMDSHGRPIGEYTRPSQHPNRQEVRIVTAVTRSGVTGSWIHRRGSDTIFDDDADGAHFEGMTPRYVGRVVGVELGNTVHSDPSAAETLGACVLSVLSDPNNDVDVNTMLPAALQIVATIIDALHDTTPHTRISTPLSPAVILDGNGPLIHVLLTTPITTNDELHALVEHVGNQAQTLSGMSWQELFALPGGWRWASLAPKGERRSVQKWFGPDLLGAVVSEQFPSWGTASQKAVQRFDVDAAAMLIDMLTDWGWAPPPPPTDT